MQGSAKDTQGSSAASAHVTTLTGVGRGKAQEKEDAASRLVAARLLVQLAKGLSKRRLVSH